eukprot:4019554-Amphidinium_carterae.1
MAMIGHQGDNQWHRTLNPCGEQWSCSLDNDGHVRGPTKTKALHLRSKVSSQWKVVLWIMVVQELIVEVESSNKCVTSVTVGEDSDNGFPCCEAGGEVKKRGVMQNSEEKGEMHHGKNANNKASGAPTGRGHIA